MSVDGGAGYIYADQNELFGQRRVAGFGNDGFFVMEIDRDNANKIIIKNHYSGKIYAASYIHLGVFIENRLVGALQFGYAMNPASQASVVADTKIDEYLELNRMWLDESAPRNSESLALSSAIKIIRATHQKIKWIQSFADERCGLGGVVYQACNFRYYGEHKSVFWELDGIIHHNSQMTRTDNRGGYGSLHLRKHADRAIPHEFRQFRYIYFMKPRFAKKCLYEEKPYPKIFAARPDDEQASSLCEAGESPAGRSINTETNT